jgi:hypothetical protein
MSETIHKRIELILVQRCQILVELPKRLGDASRSINTKVSLGMGDVRHLSDLSDHRNHWRLLLNELICFSDHLGLVMVSEIDQSASHFIRLEYSSPLVSENFLKSVVIAT